MENGGLHWLKEDAIHLCGIVISLFKLLMNERLMNLLHKHNDSKEGY